MLLQSQIVTSYHPFSLIIPSLPPARIITIAAIMKEAFYAVQQGRAPGIYSTWPQAQEQITGFKGAVFKKFTTASDAERFLKQCGYGLSKPLLPSPTVVHSKYLSKNNLSSSPTRPLNKQASPQKLQFQPFTTSESTYNGSPTRNKKQSYYAVAVGKQQGVYGTWPQCEAQVKGVQSAKYKKFDNAQAAQRYIQNHNSDQSSLSSPSSSPSPSSSSPSRSHMGNKRRETHYAVNFGQGNGEIFESWHQCEEAIRNKKGVSYKKFDDFAMAKDFISLEPEIQLTLDQRQSSIDLFLRNNTNAVLRRQQRLETTFVYMDGSFIAKEDGKAIAGYGVYFGELDGRNISDPLLLDNADSFVAEVYATRAALNHIHEEILEYSKGQGDLLPKYILATDSETVIKLLTDYTKTWTEPDYEKRNSGLVLKEAVQLYNKVKDFYSANSVIFGDHKFEVTWVKGHAGVEGNEMADQLAKLGAMKSLEQGP